MPPSAHTRSRSMLIALHMQNMPDSPPVSHLPGFPNPFS